MEDMLRRVSREHGRDSHASQTLADEDGSSPSLAVVPATSTLPPPSANAPSLKASSTATTIAKARAPRRPSLWRLCVITLLSVTIMTGLLAFIFYRRSNVAKAGDTTVVPVSEEKQPGASAEGVPQPEQDVSSETLPPSTTMPRPEPSRAPNGTEAAARPASQTSDVSTTTTPAPSPQTRQTTTTPPVLSADDHYRRGVQLWEGNRRAALEEFRAAASGGVADAYYYLGSEYYSEGRDPKTLGEGELRAALNYFLRAGGGPHSAQATRAAQALGKEYERRKKHSRP
jgi:hypothetical protein